MTNAYYHRIIGRNQNAIMKTDMQMVANERISVYSIALKSNCIQLILPVIHHANRASDAEVFEVCK